VNPTTGSVGHRRLVLDQSMIMAALDNVLNDRVMQGYFAGDPISTLDGSGAKDDAQSWCGKRQQWQSFWLLDERGRHEGAVMSVGSRSLGLSVAAVTAVAALAWSTRLGMARASSPPLRRLMRKALPAAHV
jgi:hypothetical protein